jgi:hypothetical protein
LDKTTSVAARGAFTGAVFFTFGAGAFIAGALYTPAAFLAGALFAAFFAGADFTTFYAALAAAQRFL